MAFSFKIPEKFSFRTRLFVVMIIMLLVSGVLVLGTTSIQYESQRENYHLGRLNRKESQIKRHINYLVSKNNLFNKVFLVPLDQLNHTLLLRVQT